MDYSTVAADLNRDQPFLFRGGVTVDQLQLAKQIADEALVVNRTFAGLKIAAGTAPGGAWAVVAGSSYIAYGLRLAPAVKPGDVERAIPKLAEELSAARRRPCPVRLRVMPLALEVDHPAPAPILWRAAMFDVLKLAPGSALLGRSWGDDGARAETWRAADSPHVLIAGATRSGKSTLQIMALASLMVSASPADLQVYLVDLKNEDLIALAGFPHVRGVARDLPAAVDLVRKVAAIKDQRVAAGVVGSAPLVVLAIDEYAEFSGQKDVIAAINSIASVGASKRVHLVAATQKPLADVLGSLAKANFTTRLVGRVSDAQESATATGRAKAGAEFLPGRRGAFLRVEGSDLYRFQSYLLDPAGVDRLLDHARDRWAGAVAVGSAPAAPSLETFPVMPAALPDELPAFAPPPPPAIPPDVAAVFVEFHAGGILRRGGRAAAIRAMAGDVAGGRAYQQEADEVDRLFGAWLSTRAAAPILKMRASAGG